jgi:hypothetical protein
MARWIGSTGGRDIPPVLFADIVITASAVLGRQGFAFELNGCHEEGGERLMWARYCRKKRGSEREFALVYLVNDAVQAQKKKKVGGGSAPIPPRLRRAFEFHASFNVYLFFFFFWETRKEGRNARVSRKRRRKRMRRTMKRGGMRSKRRGNWWWNSRRVRSSRRLQRRNGNRHSAHRGSQWTLRTS